VDVRDGRLTISGYLENDATHRELASLLREEAPEATLRLWSAPRILETARALLAQQNLSLELASMPGGALRVSGMLPPGTDWTRLRRILLAEVPGLSALEDSGLSVSGLPMQTVSLPQSTSQPSATAPVAQATPLTLIALQAIGEGHGWIRLSDGQVYFRGARLPDGTRLASVGSDHALIQKPEGTLRLSLGRRLAQAGEPEDANITKSLP
jgi:hypothetical protein